MIAGQDEPLLLKPRPGRCRADNGLPFGPHRRWPWTRARQRQQAGSDDCRARNGEDFAPRLQLISPSCPLGASQGLASAAAIVPCSSAGVRPAGAACVTSAPSIARYLAVRLRVWAQALGLGGRGSQHLLGRALGLRRGTLVGAAIATLRLPCPPMLTFARWVQHGVLWVRPLYGTGSWWHKKLNDKSREVKKCRCA
jgi:hypothetical protein